jgi:branched-chain amino acid transport system ATP-binding protein
VSEAPGVTVPQPAPSVLQVRDVRVEFGAVVALAGVSLEVQSGQASGLIGANGAGKSVLIDVITGFTAPSTGSVAFDGKEIRRLSIASRARLGIRRTFQNAELFDDLTVQENIAVGAPRGSAVNELLADVGLTPWAGDLAQHVPAGIRRRVDIARALAGKPRVLLLDEPGAGLSGGEVTELASWLRSIALCTHIQVLDFGRIIASGTVENVLRDSAVRRAYLGDS